MGAMYSAFPITKEMAEWLKEQNIKFPAEELSRNPHLSEIKNVLALLKDYDIKMSEDVIGDHWQAYIEHKKDPESKGWAILRILNLKDGENEFYFEKGWPDLIVEIMVELAKKTGPLVLICDAGGSPLIVEGCANYAELMASWE